jgi:hypothetical protein
MTTATATVAIPTLPDFRGAAALYKLTPPYAGVEYVVASSVDLGNADPFVAFIDGMRGTGRTEETMIFPADSDGEVTDWGELAVVPVQDHEAALADLGYSLVEEVAS